MRNVYIVLACLALAANAQTGPKKQAGGPDPAGITTQTVLDNDTVRVVRVTCEAGCSEPAHSDPANYMNVFLSDMELEFTRAGHTYVTNPVAGEVRFIDQGTSAAMRNPTNKRFAWLSIILKKDPRGFRPGVVPANTTFTGMSSRRLLDNDAVRASFLILDAGMREPPHSHPTDLLVVALTAGEIETVIGGKTERRSLKPGDIIWFPHGIEHHAANVGSTAIEDVGIHIK